MNIIHKQTHSGPDWFVTKHIYHTCTYINILQYIYICQFALLIIERFCALEALAHARAQLADPLYDPVLAALDRPSHADVLTLAAPGEVIYLWQMRKERQGQGDPVPNDDVLPDWTDLPTILSNALDREYAKYVNTTGPMKKVVPIVINVGLGVEMRYG